MARFLLLLLIFANALLDSPVFAEQSAPISPERNGAEPPSGRKLGKHRSKVIISSSFNGPSEAPRSERLVQAATAAANGGESEIDLGKKQHKSRDKSIAGGGVILGGLATTFLVAVVCYIRATRRRK